MYLNSIEAYTTDTKCCDYNSPDFYSGGPYYITIEKNHNINKEIEFSIPITAKDNMTRCTGNRTFNLTIECPSSPVGIAPCPGGDMAKVIIMDHECK